MEARLLEGFDLDRFETPLHRLSSFAALRPLADDTASLAVELLVLCSREYSLLQLHSSLLAACCLYMATRNAPTDDVWDESLAVCCGYAEQAGLPSVPTSAVCLLCIGLYHACTEGGLVG